MSLKIEKSLNKKSLGKIFVDKENRVKRVWFFSILKICSYVASSGILPVTSYYVREFYREKYKIVPLKKEDFKVESEI